MNRPAAEQWGAGVRPGVAAHHPVTAAVGARVLADGGNAADAAITATFAACVAETVLTGLAGGGFAVHWDATGHHATALDFFVDVPRTTGWATPDVHDIDFGMQVVPYTVGPTSVAVPGTVPGLGALWERFASRPWDSMLAPARELAHSGVDMTTEHAAVLHMLASVLTMNEGARIYSPGGPVLTAGERLLQPGLSEALQIVVDEGPTAFTTGTLARRTAALMAEQGGAMTADDLAAYEPRWHEPGVLDRRRHRLLVRDDLADLRDIVATMDAAHPEDRAARAVALARSLRGHRATGTTNVTAVDARGNACVISSSMGLGSGDFVPGLDLQLNSMLGEIDLMTEDRTPGSRVASNMIPLLVVDDDGLVAAGGAAGGSRIPSAMLQALLGVVDDGMDAQAAIDAPRWHPVDEVVHHEPGVPDTVLAALAAAGWPSRAWTRRHYYFGGVNLMTRNGGGGDPRRSGAVRYLDQVDAAA